MRPSPHRGVKAAAGLVVFVVFSLSVGVSSSFASEPWWGLSSGARPSYLAPESTTGEIVVTAENYGDADADGARAPIEIVDHLPKGLRATSIAAGEPDGNKYVGLVCDLAAVSCVDEASVAPYGELEMRIGVSVEPAAQEEEQVNEVVVSGGGAGAQTVSRVVPVSEAAVPFGLEQWNLLGENEGGGADTQAGSHPFQVTGTFVLNQGPDTNVGTAHFAEKPEVLAVGLARNIVTKLPPGLVGDPIPLPRCTLGQFLEDNDEDNECPADSAVGVAAVTTNIRGSLDVNTYTVPIFNLEPYTGEPARFGFFVPGGLVPVILDTSVRSNEKYAITVGSTNITQLQSLLSVRTTFWGDPGSPVHNESRGWGCLYESHGLEAPAPCLAPESKSSPAFLTMPTQCESALEASTELLAWNDPRVQVVPTSDPMPTMAGCNRLTFTPTIEASPTTTDTAAPSGLNFNLNFHDEGLTSSEGVAQSQLKDTVVTLPEGLTIDPSAGVGLGGLHRSRL